MSQDSGAAAEAHRFWQFKSVIEISMASEQKSTARSKRTGVALHTNATAEALILTAERLWGERGIEGASLREISSKAGCSNKSAIAYHFGNKDGLVAAIFNARLPSIQARRAPLFAVAEAMGELEDIEKLLTLLFFPLLHEVDRHGRHTYAAFLRSRRRMQLYENRAAREALTPLAYNILDRLRRKVSYIHQSTIETRLRLTTELCLSAIVDQDHAPQGLRTTEALREQILRDAVSASAHLLSLPEGGVRVN